jgi:hypothetical protein
MIKYNYEDLFSRDIIRKINSGAPDKVSADLSGYLRRWAINKEPLYEFMGKNLRIQKEIELSIDDPAITKSVYAMRESTFFQRIEYSLVSNFLSYRSAEEIVKNYLQEDTIVLGQKFNKGMKLSRAILQLAPPAFKESLQVMYSKFISEFTSKGRLTLSIHPADILEMSERTSGWRSCQSLDGQYRTGTLAALADKVTMVAFVEIRNSDEKLVKTWRQLVYYAPELIVQSKEYPSPNHIYKNNITELLLSLAGENYIEGQIDADYLVDNNLVYDNSGDNGEKMWYNDITQNAMESVSIIYPNQVEFTTAEEYLEDFMPVIAVGVSDLDCVCGCGEELYNPESFFSEQAHDAHEEEEPIYTCCNCDEYISHGEEIWGHDNQPYHTACVPEFKCEECEENTISPRFITIGNNAQRTLCYYCYTRERVRYEAHEQVQA